MGISWGSITLVLISSLVLTNRYLDKGVYVLLLCMGSDGSEYVLSSSGNFVWSSEKKDIFNKKSVCEKPLLKLPHLMIWMLWVVA